ncbi:LysM peptidoglycan-binding domain-containing protein [Weissella soli]|uniref:aggregation-promoting factor C-terminal-like domain-containing protein n=1 Tax=Weissella soli TaxID=155866 RepID=UPI00359F8A3E
MNSKVKETALTVAGLTAVLAGGQQVVNAATTYTVHPNDTLSNLAAKFNTTVEDLVKTNNISNADLIFTDQKLTIADSETDTATSVAASVAQTADEAASTAASQAASSAAASIAASSEAAASTAASSAATASSAAAKSSAAASSEAAASSAATTTTASSTATTTTSTSSTSGSVYSQFIAAGGTDSLWTYIVMPESGGNPNAVSASGYHGLGQTKQSWGYGDVATQTAGLVNYAVSRYGSIDAAVQFRLSNNWW